MGVCQGCAASSAGGGLYYLCNGRQQSHKYVFNVAYKDFIDVNVIFISSKTNTLLINGFGCLTLSRLH